MPPVPTPRSSALGGRRNLVVAIAAAVVVAAALIGGSLLTRGGGSKHVDSTAATLALVKGIPQNGTVLGSPTAKVRMLQFEDFQCPICKEYADNAFPAIVRDYVRTGRIQLDFRGLAFLGPDSETALRTAIAAGFQNKLWEVAGLLYAEQGKENSGWVTDAKIDEILAKVPGLDAAKVKSLASSDAVGQEAAAVRREAAALKVQGTPTFAISIAGAKPYPIQLQSLTPSAFRPALDDALKG